MFFYDADKQLFVETGLSAKRNIKHETVNTTTLHRRVPVTNAALCSYEK